MFAFRPRSSSSMLTFFARARQLSARGAVLALLSLVAMALPARAQTAHNLGATVTLGSGFSSPTGVAVDGAGNVYVADTVNNAVKEIQYSGGSYGTPVTLGSGFVSPRAVAVDGAGNVYVADQGNNAIKKIPYSGGSYGTPVILGSGFSQPFGVAVDGAGNVYVADYGNNAVKKIPYSGGSYGTPVILGSGYGEPSCVAVDGAGNVYFVDQLNNAVKQIPYSGGSYGSPVTLASGFNFPYGVAVDGAGNVYVADTSNQAVKEIPYSGGSYGAPVTLGSGFSYPYGVAVDGAGNVYVADTGNNAVKKIELAVNFGANAVGASPVSQTIAFQIDSAGTLGAPAVLTQGAPGLDFADAGTGTCTTNGTAHTYAAGDTCTVVVNFSPRFAGSRAGAVELLNSTGNVIATALISGTRNEPQVTFPPGPAPVTLPSGSGFNLPFGVAVDGAGNVYVAYYSNNLVQKIPYSGGSYGTPVMLGSGFRNPIGVAVDGAGNVYVADTGHSAVKEILYSGGSYGTPVTLGSGFSFPRGVAVDGAGNVYVADTNNKAVKEIPYSGGSYGTPVTLGSGFSLPFGVAVDGAGNVYVADQGNNAVKKVSYSGGSYGTPVQLGSGFSSPAGVAVDGAGNVYVADTGDNAVKEIPYSGVIYGTPVTLGSGFNQPYGVAVDGAGNVYVADTNNSAVKKIDLADAPTVNFPTTTVAGTTDSTDGTQTVTVQNIGNQPLLFAIPASGTNPSSPADFTFNPVGGSACPQLTSSASTFGTLAPGASCLLPLTFTPAAASSGPLSESLTLTDNNLDNGIGAVLPRPGTTQSITLTGTAQVPPPVITGLSQSSGPARGGYTVTITGSNISGSTRVGGVGYQYFFGAAQASISGFFSGTSVTVTVPAGTPGTTVAVTVVGPNGTSNSVPFTYQDAISVANSSLVAYPTSAVAGSNVTLTAMVVDVNNNPVAGETVQFSAGSSTTAGLSNGGTTSTDANGVATVTLTDTAPETLSLSATVTGTVSGTLSGSASFVAPAFTVTVTSDETSGVGVATNCVAAGLTGDNSNCSLRDAVAAADALNGVTANIGFGGNAVGTLVNPKKIQILSATPITISQNVNLNGPGANLLTIEGGTTPLSSSNNDILQISNGNVSISGLTFANAYSGSGGAIYAYGNGTLTVSSSTFSGNSAVYSGGAISATSTLTVSNSTFSGNSAGYGGAIIAFSTLTVSSSTFSGNGGSYGGAIYADSTLTVSNSTFSGNQAYSYGGAIYADSTLTVSNSTFSRNGADDGSGGAIIAYSTLAVSNSIFSGDIAPDGGGGIFAFNGGTVDHVVYNGDSFSGVTPTNSINADPNLGGLLNYGGPTATMLPLPGSAAICAGTQPMLNGTPLPTDQRGVTISGSRYGQNNCYDVGAVQTEYTFGATFNLPSQVLLGSPVTPAPAALVTENGIPFSNAVTTVYMTDADSDLSTAATVSVGTNYSTGRAVFSNLIFANPEVSDTLTATLPLNSNVSLSATSSSFQVGQLSQSITGFNPPSTATYGDAPITLSATGGASGNPVTFKVINGGPGVIVGNQLTITGAGTIKVEADQAGNTVYSAANPVTANIVVSPAVLIVGIVGNPTKAYDGTTAATLTSANYQVVHLVGSDSIVVTEPIGIYASATAGPEGVTAALASANYTATIGSLSNYVLPTTAAGQGTINQASSVTTVICSPSSVTYTGAPQTPCSASVTGAGGLSVTVPVIYSSNVNAGVNTASAKATYSGDINHAGNIGSATFTITQATPVVTWANPPSIVYGTGTGAAQKTATATGVGGVNLPGSYFYTTPDGTVFGVGTHPLGLAFTPTDSTDYVPVSDYAYLTVTKATPAVTWNAPAAITYGTALSAAQLDATSPVAGTFSYSPAAGTVLHAGAGQTLSVTFTPNDTTDYSAVTTSVPITVNKATPVITWATPAAITYGTPLSATQLDASTPVQGSFFYTGPAGLNPAGTLLPAGVSPLGAGFTPTDTTDYNTASAYVQITVNKAITTTTLAVTTTQTVTGTTATLTATVKPQIGGVPTGTVTYYNGSTVLGSAAVGTPFTTGVLPVGTDSVTAVYGGDTNFVGSSSSANAVVSLAPTTVQLASPLGTVFYPASAVSFTVTVPLKNLQLISGTITLYDGSTVIGTYTLPAGGMLAGITPTLSAGTHSLRAVYSGNAQYPPGESSIVTITVAKL